MSPLLDDTKALVRDLLAEVGEIRKNPSIAGLPGAVFSGVEAASLRLQQHLDNLDTTAADPTETPTADAGAHAPATDTSTVTDPSAQPAASSPAGPDSSKTSPKTS